MAGQRQQSQSGFGNQYYPISGQNRVSNNNNDQQAEAENDEYDQACSYVSQQLRSQIGDQRPAWDGQVPGFWDEKPPPPPSSSTQQRQQHQQSHAMTQQNQLRRPATNLGQEQQQRQRYMDENEASHFLHAQEQQQQQDYMDENDASHFLHAQEHLPASQLHKGGRGPGSQIGGSGNRDILHSMGMHMDNPIGNNPIRIITTRIPVIRAQPDHAVPKLN